MIKNINQKQVFVYFLTFGFMFFILPVRADIISKAIIIDVRLGLRTILYKNIDGFAIVEGDIILGKINALQKKKP